MEHFEKEYSKMKKVIEENTQFLKTQNIGLRQDLLLNMIVFKTKDYAE